MVPQFGHAGEDFRHARQWAELWEVSERRGPTLFKGLLTDGDLEGVSILIDHLAVVREATAGRSPAIVGFQTSEGKTFKQIPDAAITHIGISSLGWQGEPRLAETCREQ